MTRRTLHHIASGLALTALIAAGCAGDTGDTQQARDTQQTTVAPQTDTDAPTTTSEEQAAPEPPAGPNHLDPTAPNFEFPPFPVIEPPDIAPFDQADLLLREAFGELAALGGPVDVSDARCGPDGERLAPGRHTVIEDGDTSTSFNEEGRARWESEGATVTVDADGTTRIRKSEPGVGELWSLQINPDGTGWFEEQISPGRQTTPDEADAGAITATTILRSGGRQITTVEEDGAGGFTDRSEHNHGSITINGDGSGSWVRAPFGTLENNGDGSGKWSHVRIDGEGYGHIENNGDGSGRWIHGPAGSIHTDDEPDDAYEDDALWEVETGIDRVTITNHGDGTASFRGPGMEDVVIETPPLPPLPPVESMPRLDAVMPIGQSCGTVVTLSEEVLFAFDSAQLRPEAAPVLDDLAEAIGDGTTPIHVVGHTDSVGDDAYNLELSEQRAQAVAEALSAAGVEAPITTEGLGSSQPVAPNENEDGSDNPAGRQQNRRVEILIDG